MSSINKIAIEIINEKSGGHMYSFSSGEEFLRFVSAWGKELNFNSGERIGFRVIAMGQHFQESIISGAPEIQPAPEPSMEERVKRLGNEIAQLRADIKSLMPCKHPALCGSPMGLKCQVCGIVVYPNA